MKKSGFVLLGSLAVLATSVTLPGCSSCDRRPEVSQSCIGADNKVVDDHYCHDRAYSAGSYPYRWYYGGGFHPIGMMVIGGSFMRPAGNVRFTTPSTAGTKRGIFGRSSKSAGSGDASGKSGSGGKSGGS